MKQPFLDTLFALPSVSVFGDDVTIMDRVVCSTHGAKRGFGFSKVRIQGVGIRDICLLNGLNN